VVANAETRRPIAVSAAYPASSRRASILRTCARRFRLTARIWTWSRPIPALRDQAGQRLRHAGGTSFSACSPGAAAWCERLPSWTADQVAWRLRGSADGARDGWDGDLG
jgi:hypothetical protein